MHNHESFTNNFKQHAQEQGMDFFAKTFCKINCLWVRCSTFIAWFPLKTMVSCIFQNIFDRFLGFWFFWIFHCPWTIILRTHFNNVTMAITFFGFLLEPHLQGLKLSNDPTKFRVCRDIRKSCTAPRRCSRRCGLQFLQIGRGAHRRARLLSGLGWIQKKSEPGGMKRICMRNIHFQNSETELHDPTWIPMTICWSMSHHHRHHHCPLPLRLRPTQDLVLGLWSPPTSCTWTQWIFSWAVGIVKPQIGIHGPWSFMACMPSRKNQFSSGNVLVFSEFRVYRWFVSKMWNIAQWK